MEMFYLLQLLYAIFPNLLSLSEVASELISPARPIIALVGDDVILPCHLEPAASVSSDAVMWTKPGLDPKYIFCPQNGDQRCIGQHPSYSMRTALFVDQLINGNVSLKISRVTMLDAGQYFCILLKSTLKPTTVNLTVGAASMPVLNIAEIDPDKGGVVLQCNSTGWYPEPEVFWLDGEGNLLSAGPPETVRGPDDLYTVSSRVTVEKRHSNSFTCRVTQKKTNQTRETTIQVPAASELISPARPIIALVGDDVILPCHLEPEASVTSETILWSKPGSVPKYIYCYQNGHQRCIGQHPSYYRRTALFVDQLINGNVSLKIFRVTVFDAGQYSCILESMQKPATVNLTVAAASTPVLNITEIDPNKGGVVLQCNSAGWYPEPEVFWLDGEGNLLSAGPPETVRGPDDLYTVSSRVTVEKRHSNSFTCRVTQKKTNQTRETTIQVPAELFIVQSSLHIGIIIIVTVVGLVIIIAIIVIIRKRLSRRNSCQVYQPDVTLKVQSLAGQTVSPLQ